MSKKTTTPKSKSSPSAWISCENCSASITVKESDQHSIDCPPNTELPSHSFILNNILFGKLDSKSNDPIKGLSEEQKDGLVFMSQSAMKICNVAIGEPVLVQVGNMNAFVGNAWPTAEKTVVTILLTKNTMECNLLKTNMIVSVKKHQSKDKAKSIQLIVTNASKAMEVSNDLQLRAKNQFVGQYVMEGSPLNMVFFGKILKLQVQGIIPEENDIIDDLNGLTLSSQPKFYVITEKTQIILYKNLEEYKTEQQSFQHQLSTLGGLKLEIEELNTLLTAALSSCTNPIKPCRGVLLYGQSGTGKTHLAKALANNAVRNNASLVEINSTDLYSKYAGNVEDNLKKIFREARNTPPCIVLMDEVDLLCTSRTTRMTEAEKRIVSCVLSELDALLQDDLRVFVIGTTNKLEAIDSAFRRCGRFDREIEIPIPNPIGRLEILKNLLQNCDEEVMKKVAYDTHGFVGTDLISLCSAAITHSNSSNYQDLRYPHFKHALTKVRPSAMREVQIEVANVKWTDIGGQEKLKLILRQCVEWPLKHSESFRRLGIKPPRGVLMYGPPGCSKTMIAKALATESGLNFLSIKGPELFSKWVGESEKAIRDVFRKARQVAPSIIFFDEIDALGGERASSGSSSVQERVLAQLLTELDGVSSLGDVMILAATNRPDRIDHALMRPGRLDRIVYVPLPDGDTRRDIFRIKLCRMPVENVDLDKLVEWTDGYSGAEINAVCHEAAMLALEENLEAVFVHGKHFEGALKLISPRTPESLVKMYEEYNKK